MKFYKVDCTIFEAHRGNAFHLAPTGFAESFPETLDLSNACSDSDCLDAFDGSNDLEVFAHSTTGISRDEAPSKWFRNRSMAEPCPTDRAAFRMITENRIGVQ